MIKFIPVLHDSEKNGKGIVEISYGFFLCIYRKKKTQLVIDSFFQSIISILYTIFF